MPGFLSVKDSRDLQLTVLAIEAAGTGLRRAVRNENRAIIGPQWAAEVHKRSATVQQSRTLVATAKVKVTDKRVTLTSASTSRKVLSGGAKPSLTGRGFEFGGGHNKIVSYKSKRKGTSFTVTRHTARQMPAGRRSGYVVYPSFAEIAPRALALWTQTTVKIIAEAFEGRKVG